MPQPQVVPAGTQQPTSPWEYLRQIVTPGWPSGTPPTPTATPSGAPTSISPPVSQARTQAQPSPQPRPQPQPQAQAQAQPAGDQRKAWDELLKFNAAVEGKNWHPNWKKAKRAEAASYFVRSGIDPLMVMTWVEGGSAGFGQLAATQMRGQVGGRDQTGAERLSAQRGGLAARLYEMPFEKQKERELATGWWKWKRPMGPERARGLAEEFYPGAPTARGAGGAVPSAAQKAAQPFLR